MVACSCSVRWRAGFGAAGGRSGCVGRGAGVACGESAVVRAGGARPGGESAASGNLRHPEKAAYVALARAAASRVAAANGGGRVPGRRELRAGAHPRADPAAALGGGAGDQAAGAGGGGVGRRRRVAGSPTAAGMTGRWRCGRATDAPGRGGGVRSHGRGGGRPPTACSCWARAASARTPRGPCSSRAIPTRSGSRRPASHCTATAPSSTSARLRLWLARGQRAALHSSSGTNGSTSRFAQARRCFRARSARPDPNRPATTRRVWRRQDEASGRAGKEPGRRR